MSTRDLAYAIARTIQSALPGHEAHEYLRAAEALIQNGQAGRGGNAR